MQTTPMKPTVQEEPASVVSLAAGWASAMGSRISLMVELALAEAKLAAISVALMVLLAMLAAALLLGAWGLLMAGLVLGLVQLQVPLWPMLIALGALHVLVAVIAWRGVVRLSDRLEFPASRKQFNLHLEYANDVVSSAAES